MASTQLHPIADARVSLLSPNNNYGSETQLWIGKGSSGGDDAIFIKYDLSSIPTNAVINSATLKLFQYDGSNDWLSPTISILARPADKVGGGWTEGGITYNNQPMGWDVPSELTTFSNNISTSVDINVKNPLQYMVANPTICDGFRIFYTGSSNSTRKEFRSKEYSDPSKRPTLIIDYTVNTPPTWGGAVFTSPVGIYPAGTGAINVTWQAATDAGDTLTYGLWRSVNYGTYVNIYNGTALTFSDNISALAESSSFQYAVSATDTSGVGCSDKYWNYSDIFIINTKPYFPLGSTCTTNPAGIFPSATNLIVVNWSAGSDANLQALKYDVYRSVNGAAFSLLASLVTGTTYTDNTATGGGGTTYAYKIYVHDGMEYGTNQVTSATATKNTLPTWNSTTVTVAGNTVATTIPENTASLLVAWSAGNTNDAGQTLYYDVYYSFNQGAFSIVASQITATSYTHSIGVGNQGDKHQYKIYVQDGYQYASTQITSAIMTKNVMTAPVFGAIASIGYSATTVTKALTWTLAGDTLNSAKTYKISSADITIVNPTATIVSGYAMPIRVTGTYATPYIDFSAIKTKFTGTSFVGTFNIVLTATNAYGSTTSSTQTVSVDLRTNPISLGIPATTGSYRIPAATGLYYYIPDRTPIGLSWTAATDPLGTAIVYDLQASYNSGAYVTIATGLTTNSYSLTLPEQSAATTAVFKVIARSAYAYSINTVSASITLHYYRPPTIVISSYVRAQTTVTIGATITYNTSITEVAVRAVSLLKFTGKSAVEADYGSLVTNPSKAETILITDKYNFTYRVQDAGGTVIGTATPSVSIYVSAYAPMFSCREKGVAINNVVPDVFDNFIFRVKGSILIEPDSANNGQIKSTIATGTAPLVIASTTKVANLNVDMLEGYHADATAAINTIALRNASGQILATGFNNTMADTATAASHYLVETASDGWMRPKTLANVKAEIVVASEILTKIKTVDGTGSGLDAELIQGNYFTNSNNNNQIPGPDSLIGNGIGYVHSLSLFGQTDGALYSQSHSNPWAHQIYGDYRTGQMAVRGRNNSVWQPWRTLWDSSNDGAGSGLDADTVDGIQATSFIKAVGGMSTDVSSTNLNALTATGFYKGQAMTNAPDTGWYYIMVEAHDNNGDAVGWTKQTVTAFATGSIPSGTTYIRVKSGSATWNAWQKVWTSNDGVTIVRAWVNFTGSGTVSGRVGGNISNLTDLGVGDYRFNFATAVGHDSYAALATTGGIGLSGASYANRGVDTGNMTTSGFRISTFTSDTGVQMDPDLVSVAVIY